MPTKMIARPTSNFADSLIGSIGALYLTIISFTVVYAYVGIDQYRHGQTVAKLVALDKLLAMRHLAGGSHLSIRDAKQSDLPRFYLDAQIETFNDFESDKPTTKSEAAPKKFGTEPLTKSRVFLDVTMRMAVAGTCNILVTDLLPGAKYQFATFLIVGEIYEVKSENVQLVNFGQCDYEDAGLKILIFQLDDGKFAFAVPRSLEMQFFNSPIGFKNFVFDELNETVKLLPSPLDKYVRFSEDYVFLHAKTIDYFILSYANSQLGKYFLADRLGEASQQLYEKKERDASYLGISAPNVFLIRVGPFIYFALSFELWRRVRRLPGGKIVSNKYWFAFETRDVLGRVYAFSYAMAPLVFGILIYALFAISQNLGLIVFGRLVTIPGLLTLNFPRALGFGSGIGDGLAVAVGAILVPVQFLILLLTVRKLLGVVTSNLQQK